MTNLNIYAGFDVSKTSFDLCILSNGKEQTKQLSYTTEGLNSLLNLLPSTAQCIMEATGPYYLRLATFLHLHGYTVSVINPLVIRRFSQMRLSRAKTDKADAKLIASYGQTEHPHAWQPPAAYVVKLQQLDALQQQLTKQCSALKCQKEAFEATGMIDKEIDSFLKKQIDHLQRKLNYLDNRIEQIIEQHHHQMFNNILSIPGIGKKTAAALIVLSDGFTRFKSHKQLAAYIGISPRIYQSGTSVKGKTRICKMGMSRVRALLYLCAWSAKRFNIACRNLYDRLVTAGKSKRLALIAVANKLIKQIFALATSNSFYQPDYQKNICF